MLQNKCLSITIKVGKPKTITEPKTTTMDHMHLEATSVCMSYIVVMVLGSVMVLAIPTLEGVALQLIGYEIMRCL